MLYTPGKVLLNSLVDTRELTDHIFAFLLLYIITTLRNMSHSTHDSSPLLWGSFLAQVPTAKLPHHCTHNPE